VDGPWFDGVAYMKSRNNSENFVAAAKNKSEFFRDYQLCVLFFGDGAKSGAAVAIVGGGMAGLLTSLLLQSVGIKKWEIIESSHRVGGYVLDPS